MPGRPRFLADADLNPRIVSGLRRREPTADILDAYAGGTVGLPDPEVLRLAAVSDRILVSCDRNTMIRHFWDLIAVHSSPGMVIVRQRLSIGEAIEELHTLWAASEQEEWRGKVIYLPL